MNDILKNLEEISSKMELNNIITISLRNPRMVLDCTSISVHVDACDFDIKFPCNSTTNHDDKYLIKSVVSKGVEIFCLVRRTENV